MRWTFREGRHRIQVTGGVHPFSGETLDVPYGGLPRLIFALVTTSVKRRLRKLEEQGIDTANLHLDPAASQYARTVSLGTTKRQLLRSLGIEPGGNRVKAVDEALMNVFQASITYTLFEDDLLESLRPGKQCAGKKRPGESETESDAEAEDRPSMSVCIEQGMVASTVNLWRPYGEMEERGRGIVLSEMMLKFIRGRLHRNSVRGALGAVPIDRRVARLFRGRPFAFDVYLWHCVKAYQAVRWRQPLPPIGWRTLMRRFPSTYSHARSFRTAFLEATKVIQSFWPGLAYSLPRGRFYVQTRNTHVPVRAGSR